MTGVPHVEQNPRIIVFPESACETKVDSLPSIVTAFVSNTVFTLAEPDAQYWQSRHQHWRTAIGGAEAVKRTALQRHPPVMGS